MPTLPDIAALRAEFDAALAATTTVADVKALHDRFLGRKNGSVTAILKSLAGMTPDEKRHIGRDANELRQAVEAALAEREAVLGAVRSARRTRSTSRCPAACRSSAAATP